MKKLPCKYCGSIHRQMTRVWRYNIGSIDICMFCYNKKFGALARRKLWI